MAKEKWLIDAGRFRDVLDRYFDAPHVNIKNTYCEGMRLAIATSIKLLDTQPNVDAVEVVHGRWIFKHDPIADPKKYFIRIVCSECNLHTGQKSNYCPQCGAKMDGGADNGD